MDFGVRKTPVEVIKEGAFGGTYFREIYSGFNGKWYRKTCKEFDTLNNIDQKFYCSNYCSNCSNYAVKCGTTLKIWENKGWNNPIDPHGWFQWYFRYWLGSRSLDDKIKIARWKEIWSRFKGKLIKMIKVVYGRIDGWLFYFT